MVPALPGVALAFAVLLASPESGASRMGRPGCQCVGPPVIPEFDCPFDYSNNGTCVIHPGYTPTQPANVSVASDYGGSCKKHSEPGHSSCYNLTTDPITERTDRASWCDSPWCYVDPGNCDALDIAVSGAAWGEVSTHCEGEETHCLVQYSYGTCGADDMFAEEKNYVVVKREFTALALKQFTQEPVTNIQHLLPLFEQEVQSMDPFSLSLFLYTQLWALGLDGGDAATDTAFSMLYIGLETGLFTGYFDQNSHTLRHPSGRPEDLLWSPYSLATVNEDCAATTACRGVSGKRVQASGTCSSDSSCVDSNVRNYYETSFVKSGVPVNFTRWREYDPRARPWYTFASSNVAATGQKTTFSPIYPFATSGELGITATGAIMINETFQGVYGIDYELDDISSLLAETLGDVGAWAYVVERSGPGVSVPGTLVGSTFEGQMYNSATGTRLHSTQAARLSARESAYVLQAEGWSEGFFQRFDPSQGNCPRHKTCTLQASYASNDCSLSTAQLYAPMQPSSDPADSAAAGPATGAILPGMIYGRNVTACGGDAAVVAVNTTVASAEACQDLCRNTSGCSFFSYEWETFVNYEIVTGIFTGLHNEVDWLIVGGQEVSCGRKAIWAGGFCQSCEAGFQPNTRADRCLPCPLGNAGTDGSCSVCATGTIPDPSRASCETCLPGQTAFAGDELCSACPTGRTGQGGLCENCLPGYYALQPLEPLEPCTACEDLELPTGLARLDVQPPDKSDASFCPGGPPGKAGFCPQKAVYFTYDGGVKMLSCESRTSCSDTVPGMYNNSCTDWLDAVGVQQNAVCGEGRTGFLCAECLDDYTKVDLNCVPCKKTDPSTAAAAVLTVLFIALALLGKSARETLSMDDAERIWNKVDVDRDQKLSYDDFQVVLEMTGVYYDKDQLEEKFTSDFGCRSKAHMVKYEDFKRVYLRDAPSAVMANTIFFVQTFTLFSKGASKSVRLSIFGDVLNMDSEKLTGSCVMKMSYNARFFYQTLVTPMLLFGCVLVMVPVWNWLRQMKCLARLWRLDMRAPQKLDSIHIWRAMLNVFMFLFAPLTRAAVETLVCRETCPEEPDGSESQCGPVLMFDNSVKCWDSEHYRAAAVGLTVILLVVFVVPIFLFAKVIKRRGQREKALNSGSSDDMKKWFKELDEDSSGALESDEIIRLLEKMDVGDDWVKTGMAELDKEGDAKVSVEEFTVFYKNHIRAFTNLERTPLDALYASVSTEKNWWFLHDIWLKFAVNVIFTFGYASDMDWHTYMTLLFAFSICFKEVHRPYSVPVDQVSVVFLMLSLIAMTHISSIFKVGTIWTTKYVVVAAILFVLPLIVMTAFNLHYILKHRRIHKKANARVRVTHSRARAKDSFHAQSRMRRLTQRELSLDGSDSDDRANTTAGIRAAEPADLQVEEIDAEQASFFDPPQVGAPWRATGETAAAGSMGSITAVTRARELAHTMKSRADLAHQKRRQKLDKRTLAALEQRIGAAA